MFWPLILPLKIACWGLVVGIVAATTLAPRFALKRSRAVFWSTLLAMLVFLPVWMGIQFAVDAFRFGTFHHDSYEQVDDFRVYRYLPEGVTDVTLKKGGGGFQAKFSLGREEFESWIDQQWTLYGDRSEIPRAEVDSRRAVSGKEIAREFGDLAEPLPSDAVQYAGPQAANGAGFIIWYSEEQGVGYEDAGYW
jgi:hypothetical protein